MKVALNVIPNVRPVPVHSTTSATAVSIPTSSSTTPNVYPCALPKPSNSRTPSVKTVKQHVPCVMVQLQETVSVALRATSWRTRNALNALRDVTFVPVEILVRNASMVCLRVQLNSVLSAILTVRPVMAQLRMIV
jgi:hypothetical protein